MQVWCGTVSVMYESCFAKKALYQTHYCSQSYCNSKDPNAKQKDIGTNPYYRSVRSPRMREQEEAPEPRNLAVFVATIWTRRAPLRTTQATTAVSNEARSYLLYETICTQIKNIRISSGREHCITPAHTNINQQRRGHSLHHLSCPRVERLLPIVRN